MDFKIAKRDILNKRFLVLNLRHQNLFLGGKKVHMYTYICTENTFCGSLKFIDTSKLRLEPLPA